MEVDEVQRKYTEVKPHAMHANVWPLRMIHEANSTSRVMHYRDLMPRSEYKLGIRSIPNVCCCSNLNSYDVRK